MKTDITDNYPYFDQLECQFYGVCKFYEPGACAFISPCKKYIEIGEGKGISLRSFLGETVEDYVKREDLKLQIDLIRDEE